MTCWLAIITSGVISDKLIQNEKLTKWTARKLFNSIGFGLPAFAFIGLMFVTPHTRIFGFILILLNITISGFQYGGGYLVNFNDIGGRFSGVIYGISNTVGGISSVILPFLIGVIASNVIWSF